MMTWEKASKAVPLQNQVWVWAESARGVAMAGKGSHPLCLPGEPLRECVIDGFTPQLHCWASGVCVCVCVCVCVYHSSDLLFQKINDMPQDESTDIYTNNVNDILAPSISFVCCS